MRQVETTILIRTTPDLALQAFLDQEMLRGWWGVERALVEPRPGGLYTLAWKISEAGFGFVSTGQIAQYEPEKKLLIDKMVYLNPERPMLGPMRLKLSVKKLNDGIELTICQDGYQNGPDWDWYYEAVLHAWPQVARTLKDYLEANQHHR